ncbi:MAG: hypothetical protein GYB31_04045 [Bacteroidetes bacterium]|nr:hypothetical protein [Bacteroidota bacterium]
MIRFIFLSVLLFLVSVCQAQSVGGWVTFRKGKDLMKQHDIAGAVEKYKEALRLFEASGNDEGFAYAADALGGVLIYQHKNDSALLVLDAGLERAARLGEPYPLFSLWATKAAVFNYTGNYREALNANLKSLKYSEAGEGRTKMSHYSSRLIHIANCYNELLMYDSAEYFFEEAIRLKEEINDVEYLGIAYNDAALFYQSGRGAYGKAVEHFLKAIEATEQAGREINTASALNNLSAFLVEQGQNDKAMAYAKRALLMMDTLGLNYSKGNVLNSLGEIAEKTGDLKLAEEHYLDALQIFTDYENLPKITDMHIRLGKLYYKKGELELAELKAREGLNYLEKIEASDVLELKMQLLYAKILLKQNQLAAAESLLQSVYERGLSSEDLSVQESALYSLAEANSKLGQFERAYEMMRIHNVLQDTIQRRAQSRYAAQLEAEYERSKKDEAINELTYSNEIKDLELGSRKRQIALLAIGAIIALTAAFLGFYLFNLKRRNAVVLEEKNQVIAKALQEKDLLLREIHHRVKNNLQVISSLLSLQSRFVKDPQAISAINEGRSRVRSMALIHQNLYQKENITGVHVQEYFSKLLQELFDTYRIGNRVDLELKIEDLNLDVDTIIPIGLILNELVSNALKYAFSEEEEGRLTISLAEKDQKLLLSVQDNGVGFHSPSMIDKPQTFGYRLIKSLATKLKAKIKLESVNGTRVELMISDYKKAA